VKRLVWVLVILGIANVIAVGVVLGAGWVIDAREENSSHPGPYRGSEPPPGIRLPSFTLSDVVSGQLVRSADLRGQAVLVTFLDTDCSEQCPIIAGQIGQALARLPEQARARTMALAVTVNPLIDTRARVEDFLREHRVLGRLTYLSGSVAALRPVWTDFGVVSAYETGDADTHSADVRIFTPAGTWVSTQHVGVDLTPANLARDVTTALDSGA
jgi:protein SCO1